MNEKKRRNESTVETCCLISEYDSPGYDWSMTLGSFYKCMTVLLRNTGNFRYNKAQKKSASRKRQNINQTIILGIYIHYEEPQLIEREPRK